MVYRRIGIREIMLCLGVNIPEMDGLYDWRSQPITEAQKDFIHNLGVNITGIRYKGQASIIISTLVKRRDSGLATPKQLAYLLKTGKQFDFQHISKDEAGRIITKHIRENPDYNPYR